MKLELSMREMYEHLIIRMDELRPTEERVLGPTEYPSRMFDEEIEEPVLYTKTPYVGKIGGEEVNTGLFSFSKNFYENILGFRFSITQESPVKEFKMNSYLCVKKSLNNYCEIGMIYLVKSGDGFAPEGLHYALPISESFITATDYIYKIWKQKAPVEMVESLELMTDYFYDCFFNPDMIIQGK